MNLLYGEPYTRDLLRKLTGHPNQTVGAELIESLDGESRGQRFVRMRAGDIDCDVAVDRGLDIARLAFRGIPLHWISPAGYRSSLALEPGAMLPDGWGELRTWPGGMLSTFGYDHVGVPTTEPYRHGHPSVANVRSLMHGRSSYSPTYLQRYGLMSHELLVEGEVRQAAPFAEHLVLHRKIRIGVGGHTLRIHDTVRNDGYVSERIQLMYHFSFGWPFLNRKTRVRMSPQHVIAMTREAEGDDPSLTPGQERGSVERVWDRACSGEREWAVLVNEDVAQRGPVAAAIEWSGEELPHLLQWRITGESMYALGFEPSTTGLTAQMGSPEEQLGWVEPGKSRSFSVSMRFDAGQDALDWIG